MQSETRWSGPPPDLMAPSALVNVLANGILSGEQEKDAIVTRLFHMLGRNWRWIPPLAGRYLETFTGRTRPRRREVVSFLRLDRDFAEACHRYGHQIKILPRIAGPQSMQPVAAAAAWAIPRIESIGALAAWLELDASELGWLADLKALGYKRPQAR